MTTVIAVALLVTFFSLEGRLRQGAEARSLEAGVMDRGTTRGVGAAFGGSLLAVLASPLLNALEIGVLPPVVGWIGVGLMLVGLALRVWAVRVLGPAYTRTLRTEERQGLVRRGPYRLLRHPGYAGTLTMWLGAGLATGNAAATIVVLLANAIAYRARIAAEEAMLASTFGDEYREYARHSWRIVPHLY
jgi:protein-S-isoprenylcysteine O-methyltransferase